MKKKEEGKGGDTIFTEDEAVNIVHTYIWNDESEKTKQIYVKKMETNKKKLSMMKVFMNITRKKSVHGPRESRRVACHY